MVDLAGRPHFFVGAAVGLGIGGAVGLAVGEAVSTRTDVVVGFSGLFLL